MELVATKDAGDGVDARRALLVLVLFGCGRSGARYAFFASLSFFLLCLSFFFFFFSPNGVGLDHREARAGSKE